LEEVQNENGMWHVLLDRDFDDSYPETSGTGMIAGYSAIALQEGYIESENREEIKSMVKSAIKEMGKYLLPGGEIMNTCEGPGPLHSEVEYINSEPFAGNEHGYQAFIHAFTGGLRLEKRD
jgi:rhamnogalacturonyl hydrolase YesR